MLALLELYDRLVTTVGGVKVGVQPYGFRYREGEGSATVAGMGTHDLVREAW